MYVCLILTGTVCIYDEAPQVTDSSYPGSAPLPWGTPQGLVTVLDYEQVAGYAALSGHLSKTIDFDVLSWWWLSEGNPPPPRGHMYYDPTYPRYVSRGAFCDRRGRVLGLKGSFQSQATRPFINEKDHARRYFGTPVSLISETWQHYRPAAKRDSAASDRSTSNCDLKQFLYCPLGCLQALADRLIVSFPFFFSFSFYPIWPRRV